MNPNPAYILALSLFSLPAHATLHFPTSSVSHKGILTDTQPIATYTFTKTVIEVLGVRTSC